MGQGRQPQTPTLVSDLEALSGKLQGLLAAHGCGADSVGSQPAVAGSGEMGPGQVNELVETIMSELQRRGVALA